MITVTGHSAPQLYQECLWSMKCCGVEEDSRNGKVLTIQQPVQLRLSCPDRRVLFDPIRKANPYFHLMEFAWMMAGSDNVRWIEQFNTRYREYAEPDCDTVWAAYGKRWMDHFEDINSFRGGSINQIARVITMLQKDPATRRAVIAMWDPSSDLEPHNDLPCLSGDTTLKSPEGHVSLKELADRFEKKEINRWPVYSYNEDTRQWSLQWCTRVWKSGHKKTLKFTFGDGTSLRCTPDHILYKRHGAWLENIDPIQAGKLKPGMWLLGHPFWASRDWEVLQTEVAKNSYEPIHELYVDLMGWDRNGLIIHHKDNNPRNNRSDNLELMDRRAHNTHHKPSETIGRRTIKDTEPRNNKRNSHFIRSIEEWGEEDVYDFTVSENHTALVNSGVVAHNCNTHIYFRVIAGKLDMTVCNRSNDLIWGALGANVVHMTLLHELIARGAGLEMGSYRVLTNNLHVYLNMPNADLILGAMESPDLYASGNAELEPLTLLQPHENWKQIVNDCSEVVAAGAGGSITTHWGRNVLLPMYSSYMSRKQGNYQDSEYMVRQIMAPDWKKACELWGEWLV